jgi:hypothetical protein
MAALHRLALKVLLEALAKNTHNFGNNHEKHALGQGSFDRPSNDR